MAVDRTDANAMNVFCDARLCSFVFTASVVKSPLWKFANGLMEVGVISGRGKPPYLIDPAECWFGVSGGRVDGRGGSVADGEAGVAVRADVDVHVAVSCGGDAYGSSMAMLPVTRESAVSVGGGCCASPGLLRKASCSLSGNASRRRYSFCMRSVLDMDIMRVRGSKAVV